MARNAVFLSFGLLSVVHAAVKRVYPTDKDDVSNGQIYFSQHWVENDTSMILSKATFLEGFHYSFRGSYSNLLELCCLIQKQVPVSRYTDIIIARTSLTYWMESPFDMIWAEPHPQRPRLITSKPMERVIINSLVSLTMDLGPFDLTILSTLMFPLLAFLPPNLVFFRVVYDPSETEDMRPNEIASNAREIPDSSLSWGQIDSTCTSTTPTNQSFPIGLYKPEVSCSFFGDGLW